MALTGDYTNDVQYLIEMGENASLANDSTRTNIQPKLDSKGRPFIGFGYDLLSHYGDGTLSRDLSSVGVLSAQITALQNFLESHTATPYTPGELKNLEEATDISLPTQADAVTLLQNSIATAELELNKLTESLGIGDIPNSNERAALLDMWYQLPGGKGSSGRGVNGYFLNHDNSYSQLSQALKDGNRAEAWFQIRYGSADHGNNGLGVVSRRYVDSQLFGLYASPDAPTEADAIQAYQMLTTHRAQIVSYEQQFGSNPYGSDPYGIPAASQIGAANQNYSLSGTANQVQTLAQIFDSVAQEEIQYLAGQYSGVLPSIQVDDSGGTGSSNFDVRSVEFYAASASHPTVDGGSYASADHILLGSETGDQLIAGEGSDILIAQNGDETLQAGAEADTLIANGGNDTLRLGGGSDTLRLCCPARIFGPSFTVGFPT